MNPSISLVMTAWNRERYIADAIKSVLAQTRKDFELIVWDDGSTDETVKVAERAINGDPRVRIMRGEHRNQIHSINAACEHLHAPLFATVDSDDILAETALAEAGTFLEENASTGMVYTNYTVIDESNRVRGLGVRTKIPYSRDRLLVDFMTFHFRLMRRSVFDAAGRMEPLSSVADDYDLCLRISEIAEIRHLPKPLYFYRLHEASESVKRRLDQIEASAAAIRRAIIRRGLAERYDLKVEYSAKYSLKKKT